MGPSRRTRVYVSFHPSTGPTARKVRALLEQLRTALAANRGRSWEIVAAFSRAGRGHRGNP
jgi:hypothetical protein